MFVYPFETRSAHDSLLARRGIAPRAPPLNVQSLTHRFLELLRFFGLLRLIRVEFLLCPKLQMCVRGDEEHVVAFAAQFFGEVAADHKTALAVRFDGHGAAGQFLCDGFSVTWVAGFGILKNLVEDLPRVEPPEGRLV